VTPYLLEALSRGSGGRTLAANVALLLNNARVAALIAVAYGAVRSS
jgi:pseudouridine-5'-phosphate glycosidase